MSGKSLAIKRNVKYKSESAANNSRVIVGSLIFVMAFILLAYMLGNAEVAANPYVPNHIL